MALSTTSDLLTYMQDELGDTAPNATTQAKYLDVLDRAHKVIVAGGGELNVDDEGSTNGRPYIASWAVEQSPIVVNTEVAYTTGTVSVTKGSTSATLSATKTTSAAGWYLKISGKNVVYRVSAHTAGTDALTLDGGYIDDTDSAAQYELIKLDYTFAPSSGSLALPVGNIVVSNYNYAIDVTSREQLESDYPIHEVNKGYIKYAGLVKQTSTGIILRMSHYTSDVERLELHYVKVPETLTTGGVDPILPSHHRIVIPHLALYYLLRRYDDDRAESHLQSAKYLFKIMKEESQHLLSGNDDNFAAVIPWRGWYI